MCTDSKKLIRIAAWNTKYKRRFAELDVSSRMCEPKKSSKKSMLCSIHSSVVAVDCTLWIRRFTFHSYFIRIVRRRSVMYPVTQWWTEGWRVAVKILYNGSWSIYLLMFLDIPFYFKSSFIRGGVDKFLICIFAKSYYFIQHDNFSTLQHLTRYIIRILTLWKTKSFSWTANQVSRL